MYLFLYLFIYKFLFIDFFKYFFIRQHPQSKKNRFKGRERDMKLVYVLDDNEA